MTNIERLLTDAGAAVDSKGLRYVVYHVGGVFVTVRPAERTWSAYMTVEVLASEASEDKERKTLSAIRERAKRLKEIVAAMRGLKDPWGEAPAEDGPTPAPVPPATLG